MAFRLAGMEDLPQLKAVYRRIIDRMDSDGIAIWDDVYPCEFLGGDIECQRLYMLTERGEIAAAFALLDSNAGANHVQWADGRAKAVYLDRLGIGVDYWRNGLGSAMLDRARALAMEKGAQYLRLFVVDINEPAIGLYAKNGFQQAGGFYDEDIGDGVVLRQLGFEIATSD